MQSVMFNSQHISVSKDTLHNHKILTSSLETKIPSMHSGKDQKNEIRPEYTSRAAVSLLDPLISRCFTTASASHRQSAAAARHNGRAGARTHKRTRTPDRSWTVMKLQNVRQQTTSIFSYYSCSSGSNQMRENNNDSSVAFACPCGKYRIINHITKK